MTQSCEIRRGVPLAPLTTWKIGGTAAEMAIPRDADELCEVVSHHDKVYVLGGGSNVLINDGMIEGMFVSTERLLHCEVRTSDSDIYVSCGVGMRLSKLVSMAAENGWSGVEQLFGIPGTIGGALYGNAGTRMGAIADAVDSVELTDASGDRKLLSRYEMRWEYRRSFFCDGDVIVGAVFKLRRADKASVALAMKSAGEARAAQPTGVKTAGCVFKNPAGDSAGRLLDTAGCKGVGVGGASVSDRHANFFINDGTSTAADMAELIARCARRVYERHGVRLELEVRTVGFDEPIISSR